MRKQPWFLAFLLALTLLMGPFAARAEGNFEVPLPPTVFLGDYGQAAIVFDYNTDIFYIYTSPKYGYDSYEYWPPPVMPSILQRIWFDGEESLYMLLEPEPIRLFRWTLGEDHVDLVCAGDEVEPTLAALNLPEAPEHVPNEDELLDRLGDFTYWYSERSLSLPGERVALVGPEEGIIIYNTSLPARELAVEGSHPDYDRFFFMANPDVHESSDYTARFKDDMNFIAYITEHAGEIDVHLATPTQIAWGRKAGVFADFSSSAYLAEQAARYYPAFAELCGTEAVPLGSGPEIWWINMRLWEQMGLGPAPRTMDDVFAAEDILIEKAKSAPPERVEDRNPYVTYVPVWTRLASRLVDQYITQYAEPGTPLSFDTEVFRDLLVRMRQRAMRQNYWVASSFPDTNPKVVQSVFDLLTFEPIWEDLDVVPVYERSFTPIAPPVFEEGSMPRVLLGMGAYAIDAKTDAYPEAVRFLEFRARYRFPQSVVQLMPSPAEDVFATGELAYRDLAAHGWVSAHETEDADWRYPLIRKEQIELFQRQLAQNAVCLLGGDYWMLRGDAFQSINRYILGERDDLDGVIAELDAEARWVFLNPY